MQTGRREKGESGVPNKRDAAFYGEKMESYFWAAFACSALKTSISI